MPAELEWVVSLLVSFAVTVAATVAIRYLARRFGWVAKVRTDRWHKKPTALHGGVAIYCGFIAAYLIKRPSMVAGDAILVICSSGIFLLGFIDDVFHLKPYAKLVGQIILATALTTFGLRLPWTGVAAIDISLTIFWLTGLTNAMNLMDNIDGLAAGLSVIATGFLIFFFINAGQFPEAWMAAAIAGGAAGFLVFNFNPASIFMGDSGSLFLGFFLGGVTLLNQTFRSRNLLGVLAVPVLLMLIPILDTTFVTVSRKLSGRPVSKGGRDHTSHRLVALGLSERAATLSLWALSLLSGLLAVAVRRLSWTVAIVLITVFALTVVFIAIYLGRVHVYEGIDDALSAKGRATLPTLADFAYKRRVFEVLNDLVLIVVAYIGAFLLRFDGMLTEPHYSAFVKAFPGVIVIQMTTFLLLGLYRGVWRYTTIDDLFLFVKAVAGAVAASTVFVLLFFRFHNFSRAVFVLDAILLLFLLTGTRLSFRLMRSWLVRRFRSEGRRTLIYGAGDGGELLVREIASNDALKLKPLLFVDDDPAKQGKEIHGIRIVGDDGDLRSIIAKHRIQELIVSTTKIPTERWERLRSDCAEMGVVCRRMKITLE